MKNIFSFIILCSFLCLLSLRAQAQQTCPAVSSASYEIKQINRQKNNHLHLYRTADKVAHRYPDTAITEVWERNTVGQIKPTRYFDAHQRAIEYQPNESVHGKVEKDWLYRYQLISQRLINKANILKTTGKDCDVTQHLQIDMANTRYLLNYQPSKQLLTGFKIVDLKNDKLLEEWHLKNTSNDETEASALFSSLMQYQATDFADIGDDHTDPFLTNMVSVGFIEAGASGFYHAFEKDSVKPIGEHRH